MTNGESPQGITFWLQEAKSLMMAAEQCWRSDAAFQQQGEQAKIQLFNNKLVQMYVDAEVELNWLYNILAGLSIYYISTGILVHRDPSRSFEQQQPRIIDQVNECGIDLDPIQKAFLQRVEQALWLADKKGPWSIELEPEHLKTMKRKIAAEELVTEADKRAIDALFARLISAALQELAGGRQ